jgi:hypothetical protein
MRVLTIALTCLLVAACRQDRTADESPRLRPGEPGWTESSGEVSLTDGETLSFTITSERYKAWDAARQGIDQRIASRYGAILQAASPSRRTIERAVQYLESEPAAVASIERAGMSVRDFVVTTVALEQEMRLADARGEIPPDTLPTAPYPGYQPYPVDTSSFSTYTPVPVPVPMPVPTEPVVRQYIDTFPRPDTMPRRDTSFTIIRTDTAARRFPIADSIAKAAARRDSIARATPRPDSVISRRDTVVRRDTAVRRDSVKPPVDTLRDTILAPARSAMARAPGRPFPGARRRI